MNTFRNPAFKTTRSPQARGPRHQLGADLRKMAILFLGALFITGCASIEKPGKLEPVAEIRPGILQGYLPDDALPDSLALIPPPPVKGSAAMTLDQVISKDMLSLKDTPRWTLARDDADLMFPHAATIFSCALDAPVTEQDTPHLYRLLRRTLADAGLSTYAAKNHYQRKRPFMVNGQATCTPEDEEHLRKDGSYPSGHAAIGWAWALILTEVSPQHGDAILSRGREFGKSRVVCNAHWNSDVGEGIFMGSTAVARLHANRGFQADLAAAKLELAAVRAKGLKPDRDCSLEAAALAQTKGK